VVSQPEKVRKESVTGMYTMLPINSGRLKRGHSYRGDYVRIRRPFKPTWTRRWTLERNGTREPLGERAGTSGELVLIFAGCAVEPIHGRGGESDRSRI